MISDELERLQQLKNAGSLSEEEFQHAKQRLLSGNEGTGSMNINGDKIQGMEPKTWNMLMHLSQLLILAGGVGIAAPIIMWALSKDQSADANRHGLVILNWLISSLIYAVVSTILVFVVIGIPMILALGIATIVFPIIGAVRANAGDLWKYPLSIEFFKIS